MVGAAVVGAAVVGGEGEPPQADGAATSHYKKFKSISGLSNFSFSTCHAPIVASYLVVSCQVVFLATTGPFLWKSSITHQTLTVAGTILSAMLVIKIMIHAHVVPHFMGNNLQISCEEFFCNEFL